MASRSFSLLFALPVLVGCLNGGLERVAPRGRDGAGPGRSLVDVAQSARRAAPAVRGLTGPRAAAGLDAVRPYEPPTLALDDGWQNRGGDVDELGGAQQWQRTVGATGWDSVQQVARYDADEVVVIGWIEGSVDFGGLCGVVKPGQRTGTEDFAYSNYVARLTDAGVCQWIDAFDSDDAWPVAVAVDAAKDIYVAGMFSSEVRFGDGFDLVTSGMAEDVFLARYTDKGLDWTRSITGTSDTWAYDVAVVEDGDGADLVLVGSFDGTAQLDGTTSLTASGGYDMLVARWSSTGALVFATAVGAEGTEDAGSVAVVGTDIVVAGTFDSATLPVGGVASFDVAGTYDSVLIGFGASGTPRWARQLGGDGPDWIADVAAVGGDVAMVGCFSGAVTFAGLPELASDGTSMLVARVSGSGNGQWAHVVSSAAGLACATSVRVGPSGDLYVASVIDGAAAFGATLVSPAAGAWSIVSARYVGGGGDTPRWASKRDRTGSFTTPLLDLSDRYVVLSADVAENGGDGALYGLGL